MVPHLSYRCLNPVFQHMHCTSEKRRRRSERDDGEGEGEGEGEGGGEGEGEGGVPWNTNGEIEHLFSKKLAMAYEKTTRMIT